MSKKINMIYKFTFKNPKENLKLVITIKKNQYHKGCKLIPQRKVAKIFDYKDKDWNNINCGCLSTRECKYFK